MHVGQCGDREAVWLLVDDIQVPEDVGGAQDGDQLRLSLCRQLGDFTLPVSMM